MSSLMPAARFAYDRSGSVLAGCDGDELFAWSGADERPLWRTRLGGDVIALATTVGEVLALEARGRLHRFEALTGATLGVVEVGRASALAVARNGAAAVLVDDGVLLVTAGRAGARLTASGQVVALRDDGGQLAIGGSDGRVQLFELARPGEPVTLDGGGEVHGLQWNVRGFWCVAAGERVMQLGAAPREVQTLVKLGRRALGLATSADGGLVAVQTEPRAVEVYALPGGERVGRIVYAERDIDGLSFGPDVWLGVGLRGGDGNKINLLTGACHRTDPHEGRRRETWHVLVEVDKERIKEGRSTANPSAEAVRNKLAHKRAEATESRGVLVWVAAGVALALAVAAALLFTR